MSEQQRVVLRGLKLGWDPERSERLLSHVQTRLERQRRQRRAALLSASFVTLLCVVGVGWRWKHAELATISAKVVHSAGQQTSALVLRDGSEIRMDKATTALRVVEESPAKVRVELERGSARYSVAPHPERNFEIRAGAVTVTVVGTEFVVERRGESTWVEVSRGKVRVSWGDEQVFLVAGESGLFPRAATPTSPHDDEETAGEALGRVGATTRAQQASQAYRARIARQDYRGAYKVLSQNPSLAGDTVQELLLAADVARLSAHPADAVPYLQRILRDHAQDARAPMAAFTLGRTFSGLGRTREALNMFGRVRSAWPKSSLAEDALIRQTEASAQLGDLAGAARFATEYDREYPRGHRRTEVRRYARLE